MFSKQFVREVVERAVKTAAQAGLLAIGAAEGFNVFTLDVKIFIGFMLGGALLSVLTSLASAQVGSKNSASLVKE